MLVYSEVCFTSMSIPKDIAPTENRYCPNCHYPLAKFGEFCSNCGQKYTDGKVPLWVFLHDLTEAIFNIDSKIFNTVFSLFIPGKLTIQFFKGRQKRYATPLRLFLILAIVHFAALSWMIGDEAINFSGNDDGSSEVDAYSTLFLEDFDTIKEDIFVLFDDNPLVKQAIDSLEYRLDDLSEDSLDLGYLKFDLNNLSVDTEDFPVAKVDLYTKTPEELVDLYGLEDFWDRLQMQQILRIRKDGKSFSSFAIGQLVWMVALMMPALAFLLKLLYIRRKKYFVEHLVFSFHYHAFAFLVFTFVFSGLRLLELGYIQSDWGEETIAGVPLIGVLIYLFIAMRRVYGQGYIKTFIKYSILNFSYIFIFTVFLVLTLLVSFLFY